MLIFFLYQYDDNIAKENIFIHDCLCDLQRLQVFCLKPQWFT